MKFKKNKNGMTLVEVLVAMALFAIFSLIMASAFTITYRMNLNNHEMNKDMDTQGAQIEAGTPSGTATSQTFSISVNGRSFDIDADVYRVGNTNDDTKFLFFKKTP
ncbi:MAG: prepilin-type N-terminal cleavage/methylation domain-containing protein [Oscillospiraceae bacterium]|jgi:prepilin-type N-terminal cleavage/methylation domain-containing protein